MSSLKRVVFIILISFILAPVLSAGDPCTTEGLQRYNSTDKVMEFCDGSEFISMKNSSSSSGGGSTTAPTFASQNSSGGSVSGSAWSKPNGGWAYARGITAKNTGKWCWDFRFTGGDNQNHDMGIGKTTATESNNWIGNNSDFVFYETNGSGNITEFYNTSGGGTSSTGNLASGTFTSGTLGRTCVDFDNSKIWLSINAGSSWVDSGNPATNSGGQSFSIGGAMWNIIAAENGGSCTVDLLFDTTNALPSGFSRW